ncbi:HNH endonuclease family protein [Isoptericola sp. b490]|uniref:HNH endonuclease family protein n=1 Tax=Actinotalea lenta TaxID=3064654 RepID=UPI0027128CCE|nr:HNH endonuclease family protein [Isoptericola sp. b490]MDO8122218.1 HNH endonuclease family protein [Isoptericola sp. b490]
MRHGRLRRWAPVLVLLVVAAVAWWASMPDPGPPVVVPAVDVATARDRLAELPVHEALPSTGYRREEFGNGWAERDGCSTREQVLARDLTGLARAGCRVLTGTLEDPYGGSRIAFTSDRPSQVQIDHVVALADAWRTGAQDWSPAERTAFANDLVNLLAVSGDLNQDKGASDASAWLPPARSLRCPYVIRQIAVKARWGLWVTPAERAALDRELGRCRTVVVDP